MKWSLYLGKVSGIKIFIHWTFLILLFWIIQVQLFEKHGLNEILLNIALLAAVFTCIVLHELGHALTAKRYNIRTRDIILLPIGGLARMESLPEKPKQELLIAVMGPVVNLVIGAILFIILYSLNEFPASIEQGQTNFLFQLFEINIVLAVFNFIPAFPMDGGRVLRALLSLKYSRLKATRIAVYAGQFIAILFVFLGFSYSPMLIFIGLFIFLGAQAEAHAEEIHATLKGVRVADVLMHRYSVLKPDESLSNAVHLLLDSQEHSFIVQENNKIKGTLSRKDIIEGISKYGSNIPVEKVMQSEVFTIKANDLLDDVMQKFSKNREAIVPVLDGEQLMGVLDLENITEFIQIQGALHAKA